MRVQQISRVGMAENEDQIEDATPPSEPRCRYMENSRGDYPDLYTKG
jgi:hypothetical protein